MQAIILGQSHDKRRNTGRAGQTRAVFALKHLVDPSSKSPDALQDLLMRMRAEGSVKFDIKSGKWSKA